jgi:hypothetical protein
LAEEIKADFGELEEAISEAFMVFEFTLSANRYKRLILQREKPAT